MVKCKECVKRLSSKESLKTHTKRYHEQDKTVDSRIECKNRGTKLSRKSLPRHMHNVHKSVNNSEYESLTSYYKELMVVCKECGKRLSSKESLKRHTKRAHEQDKTMDSRIECNNCGKKLYTESMQRHMRDVHDGKKTWQAVWENYS